MSYVQGTIVDPGDVFSGMMMKDRRSGERKRSRMNEKEEDCDDYGCHLPGAYYGLAIGKCYIYISCHILTAGLQDRYYYHLPLTVKKLRPSKIEQLSEDHTASQ